MKLMIASDIHGSAAYCRQLKAAFDREQPDKLLLLGDILYHGPRNPLPPDYNPQEVTELLNGIREHILCVRGNCDTEVDQMLLQFPILADYCTLFWQGKTVFATHGHRFHPEALPPLTEGDILLCGHTHVPACVETDGILYLNPGSVSIPKEDSPHGYMTFEGTAALWKDLTGKVWKREEIF
ncbi:MAG: phosphodiesterase [Clostridia bacterium]|nr:phosphodiesterase [Clostridia bacterium]